MPISHKSPYRRHVFGAFAICLAGVAMMAARQQGWLVGTADSPRDATGKFEIADADVPPPDDDLPEMPSEIDIAQSEIEESEPVPESAPALKSKKRTQLGEWEASSQSPFERDDGIEEVAPSGRNPESTKSREWWQRVFEEDAPAGARYFRRFTKTLPAASRGSRPASRSLRGSQSDSTKGASLPEPIETDQTKKAPLLNGDKIQAMIDEGNYIDAQKELSQWYWQKPAEREQILPRLNKLARALYFFAAAVLLRPVRRQAGRPVARRRATLQAVVGVHRQAEQRRRQENPHGAEARRSFRDRSAASASFSTGTSWWCT